MSERVTTLCTERFGRPFPLQKLAYRGFQEDAVRLPHRADTQRMNPPCGP
ncbi:unnamed protein product [Ectocarpus sp. CCAP 1310/34]|nr:unnamed protein product [Ectocarpus sp. CCAP 1310/34]